MIRPKGDAEKPIRSIEEFRRRYFPKSYIEELKRKERESNGTAGTGLIPELLENLRRDLARQKKRRKHPA